MFEEEAGWIERVLAGIQAAPGTCVLDIGSSTAHFRTVEQPFIETRIFAPLRARGAEIVHLDAKPADGVDVVCDLTDPGVDVAGTLGRRFDVVLCCNLLEHVVDRETTVDRVAGLVAPGGTLIVTVPGRYRYHEDPIDTLFRPSPQELIALVTGRDGGLAVRSADTVRIRQRRYYKFDSRYLRERVIEGLFWLLPKYNWRQTCVMFARETAPPAAASASAG